MRGSAIAVVGLLLIVSPFLLASGNPGNQPQGKLIFSEDFSKPESGWGQANEPEYVYGNIDGEYQIKNISERQITTRVFKGREMSDGDFSVTAHRVSGPDDIRFGLIARYSDEGFLGAAVLPDGRYALWAPLSGKKSKTEPVIGKSPAVRPGNQPNTMRLVVKGAHAIFYVNGTKVAEMNDVPLGKGFGFFANSTSAASDVRFDNYELREAR